MDLNVKPGRPARRLRPADARSGLVFEAMEPRVLMSADALGGLLPPEPDSDISSGLSLQQSISLLDNLAEIESKVESSDASAPALDDLAGVLSSADQDDPVELVFIDSAVQDHQQLIEDLELDAGGNLQVHVLEASIDGVQQISEVLQDYRNVSAIHLFSHADQNGLQLGDNRLDTHSLDSHAQQLASWSEAMTDDGDILIYGCNLAATDTGQQLLEQIGLLTGADVAASDDLTGDSELGGDWDLEYLNGEVEASFAFNPDAQQNWNNVLATFTVNSISDTIDDNLGDSLAEDASGNTTLRAAIMEANALGGSNTIILGPDIYELTLGSSGENFAAQGDLDITSDITILGASAATTIIDASGIVGGDRVFDVRPDNGNLSLSDLTVTGGLVTGGGPNGEGGAIDVANAMELTLDRVIIDTNTAVTGGGIYSSGTVNLTDVVMSGNEATGGANEGGAILNDGTATLDRVTISDNSASQGGGIFNASGATSLDLTNVTISGNTTASGGEGGGLYNMSTANLKNVTVANNAAQTQGGGIYTTGTINISNTIVADNTSIAGSGNDVNGAFISDGSNIIEDTATASGLGGDTTGDPNLDALADNGGFTQTHALLPGSIAIDNVLATAAPASDQRGFGRPNDGDGDLTVTVDIGAYELQSSLIVDTTNDTLDAPDLTSISALLDDKGTDGFISLREAIIAANNTDGANTIQLTSGTYTLSVGGAGEDAGATGDLDIDSNITITGAGVSATVIDAEGIDRIFDVLNDQSLTISDLTLEDGDASGGGDDGRGGGIFAGNNTTLTLGNVVVQNNHAVVDGAGIYTDGSSLLLTDVTIQNNGDLNTEKGGGIFTKVDTNTLDRVTISGNMAHLGAGIYNESTLNLSDVIVSGNTTGGGANQGGGLYNDGVATLNNATVSNNSAAQGGGIFNKSGGGNDINLTNVTISGNTATGAEGGGLYNDNNATLKNVTVANNTAQTQGGGIYNADTINISNTIVADNTSVVGSDDDVSGAFTSDGSNIIEVTGTATGLGSDTTGDPNLAALANNGGFTQTHALLPGSIAIDNVLATAAPASDQRGFARDASPDIGAYEFAAAPASLWLTSFGDVLSPSGAPGLDAWTAGEVLSFDNPNLTFDTAGTPSNTTDGTFSSVFNFDSLVQDSDARLNGLHYVQSNITVGSGANDFDLHAGDVLFTTQDTKTLQSTNSLTVTGSDVVVFRPDTAGNYASGTFTLLLDGTQIPEIDLGLHGLTLVESDTMIGDSTLQAGTFLLVDADDSNIYHYTTDEVGAGSTSGTWSTLIEGADINIGQFQRSIDLIETPTDLGGTVLPVGTLLLSLNNDDTVGDNSIAVQKQDLFYLSVSKTEWDQATTVADATLFLDGSDVGINADDERFHGLTLVTQNSAPTLVNGTFDLGSTDEDTSSTGVQVSTIVTGLGANDLDGDVVGMAVTMASGNGTWQFSIDSTDGSDGNWTDFGSVATNSALLLSESSWVRYQPDGDNGENVGIDFHAWDGSTGSASSTGSTSTADPDGGGGNKAFSTNIADASLVVTDLNDAPGALNLTSTSTYFEGDASVDIDDIIVSDVDTTENVGVTLTLNDTTTGGLSGNDGAVYNPGNGEWTIFGTLSAVNNALANMVFNPNTDNDQDTTISVEIDDGDEDSSGPLTGTITLDVTPIDDPINVNTSGNTVTFTEDAGATAALFTAGIDTIETSDTISQLVLTLANVEAGDTLLFGATSIDLNSNGATGPDAAGFTYTVSSAGTNPEVTISHVGTDDATVNTMLNSLVFDNGTNNDPSTTARTVTLTSVTDSGSGLTADGTVATVNVTPVNDGPGITSTAPTTATEDTLYTYTPTVVDVDDANDGTNLTWSLSGEPAGMTVSSTGVVNWTPANGVTTSGAVTLTVQDGGEDGAVAATETFTITVTPVNDGPGITSTAPTTATEDTLYTYTPTVVDVDDANDGTNLTWSLSGEPAGMTVSSTGVVNWTPANGVTTSGAVTLTVQDGGEDGAVAATETFTITVTPVNDGPGITSTAPTTATEDTLYTYTPTVVDVDDANDGTNLTWSLSGEPAGMTVSSTGVVNWTPANGVTTSGAVTLTVQDGGEDGAVAATETFTITVTPVNDGPGITSTAPTTATEDTLYTYTPTVVDVDDANDGTNLTWSLSGEPAGMTVSSTGVVNWTPANGVTTSGAVTLTVQDGGEDGAVAATETFTITVTPVNDGPSITSTAPTTATEDTLYTYTPTVVDVDDANDGTNLTWSLSGEPAGMTVSSTGVVNWTPANGVTTSGAVTLTVQDGGEDGAVAATETFTITVTPVNDGPGITSTAPTTATEDTLYTYTPTVVDVDDANDGTNLTWSLSGEPAGMTVSSTGVVNWTPANGVTTSGAVTLTVQDGGEDGAVAATETITITVTPVNDAPTLDNPIADQTATEDSPFTFTFAAGTFSDEDVGDSLTYSASLVGGAALPAWLDFDDATRTFSGTPGNDDVGTLSIEVTADDGNGGLVATDSFDIVVGNSDDDPTLVNPIADQAATEDSPFTFTFAAGTFSDEDVGDSLTYSASLVGGAALPAWLDFDDATRTFSGTPGNDDVGTLSIEVTADDGNGGLVATDSFDIVVGNSDDDPTLVNPIADQAATEDSPFTFTFAADTFSDEDVGDSLTYSASLVGGAALPAWLDFDDATRTLSGTPDNDDVGTLSIEVTADDGNGGPVATDSFDLVITSADDAPTLVNPIADQAATEDSPFTFTFAADTFSDEDVGDSLTYSASLVGGAALPAWLDFDDATRTLSGTPDNDDVGTLSIEVTADDGNGGPVATDSFDLVITSADDAPTLDNPIADQTATEDSPFTFTFAAGTFSDEDVGDSLTYSASLVGGAALPAWLDFDDATRTFSGTPGNDDVGTLSIEVTADDGNGGPVATDSFDIVVGNSDDDPTLVNPIADQTATEDSPFAFTFAADTFSDEDVGDSLTYSASLVGGAALPAWLDFDDATRTLSGTPDNDDVGTLNIQITARDGNGGPTSSDSFTLEVLNANDAPSATNLESSLTLPPGSERVALNDIVVSDVDTGEVITATLSLANPELGTLSANDGASYDADSGIWSITGTVGEINTALANVTFEPTNGFERIALINVSIDDDDEDASGPLLGELQLTPVSDFEAFDATPDVVSQQAEQTGIVLPESAPQQDESASADQADNEETSSEEQESSEQDQPAPDTGSHHGDLALDSPLFLELPAFLAGATDNTAEPVSVEARTSTTEAATIQSIARTDISTQFLKDRLARLSEPFQLLDSSDFKRNLDKLREEFIEQRQASAQVIGNSLAVSTSLTVGYVIWLARSGIIMSSVLSSLPAWRFIDPLPVLSSLSATGSVQDDESLESMVRGDSTETNLDPVDEQPGPEGKDK